MMTRLDVQARIGREANTAAAAAAAAAASPARWKPGQDHTGPGGTVGGTVDGVPSGLRRQGGDADKKEDAEEELEVVTAFDENGRPVRTGGAALMREDMRTG